MKEFPNARARDDSKSRLSSDCRLTICTVA